MNQRSIWIAIAALFMLLALSFASDATERDDVKYCIDLRTQKIIVVRKGMPCPYPTTEL